MKRILIAVALVLSVAAALWAERAWSGYESQHIEIMFPRINGSGTIERWYKLLPASSVAYDTTAATHTYAALAETSPLPKGTPTSKWYDMYGKKCTQVKIDVLFTDVTSDEGGMSVYLMGSENGKDQYIVDYDIGNAEGTWYTKDFTADSSGFPRYLSVAVRIVDTHNAAAVVRNQLDASIKFFSPAGQVVKP